MGHWGWFLVFSFQIISLHWHSGLPNYATYMNILSHRSAHPFWGSAITSLAKPPYTIVRCHCPIVKEEFFNCLHWQPLAPKKNARMKPWYVLNGTASFLNGIPTKGNMERGTKEFAERMALCNKNARPDSEIDFSEMPRITDFSGWMTQEEAKAFKAARRAKAEEKQTATV
jgi:hypothetical protein